MGVVKFKTGTAAAFALLESKDNDTLYIITDEKKIYKGDICLSSSYKTVAELPGTGELNTIYVNTTDGSVSYWNGTGYQTIVKATTTALSGTGDNLTFPTTKAVIDYITSKMADLDVGALEGRVSTIEGQITTINGEGEGSIKKALSDAKAYADSLAPNYAAADHDHTLADITDAGALAGKSQVAEGDLDSALAGKINGKADKATTLEGYGITDAYTKSATDSAIAQAVASADHLKREIVEDLPNAGSADEHTIYMVGDGSGLYLRVYSSGCKIWINRKKVGGKFTSTTLGEFPATSIQEARRLNQELAPKEDGSINASALTFRQLSERWLELRAQQIKDVGRIRMRFEKYLPKLYSRRFASIPPHAGARPAQASPRR